MVDELHAAFAHELQNITHLLRGEILASEDKIMALIEGERTEHTAKADQLEERLQAQQETLDQVAGTFLENQVLRPNTPHGDVDATLAGGKWDQARVQLLALEAAVEDMRQEVGVSSEKRALSEVLLQDLRKDFSGLQEKMHLQEKSIEEAHATQQVIEKSVGGLYRGVEEITAAIVGSEQKLKAQLGELVKECEEREERQRRAAKETVDALEQKLREEQDSSRKQLEDMHTGRMTDLVSTLEMTSASLTQGIADEHEKRSVAMENLSKQVDELRSGHTHCVEAIAPGAVAGPLGPENTRDIASLAASLAVLRHNIEEAVSVVGEQMRSAEGVLDSRFSKRMEEERSLREADMAKLHRCMEELARNPPPDADGETPKQWQWQGESPCHGPSTMQHDLRQLREEVSVLRTTCTDVTERVAEWLCKPLSAKAEGDDASEHRKADVHGRPATTQQDLEQLREEVAALRSTYANVGERFAEMSVLRVSCAEATDLVAADVKRLEHEYAKMKGMGIESRLDTLEERANKQETKHSAITSQMVEIQSDIQRTAQESDVQRLEERLRRMEENRRVPQPHSADRLSVSVDRLSRSTEAVSYLSGARQNHHRPSSATRSASVNPVGSGPAVLVAMAAEAMEESQGRPRVGDPPEKYSISTPATPRMGCRQLIADDMLMHSAPHVGEPRLARRADTSGHPSLAQLASAKDKIASLLASKAETPDGSPTKSELEFSSVRAALKAMSPAAGGAQQSPPPSYLKRRSGVA
jgi:uncharacterized coiled-coil protein SlyX